MMLNALPITILAQLNDVTVLQTAAYRDAAKYANHKNKTKSQQADYGAFNLGLHVNDNAASVLSNRMQLLAAINQHLSHTIKNDAARHMPVSCLHWVNQVHGNHVYDVGASSLAMQPQDADALVARQAGQGLAIMTADCVPIVLYQPATGQIAAIHAGWQGLACGVIDATVAQFTIDAAMPIMAWIGTCISQDNYEVNQDTAATLKVGCLENDLLAPQYKTQFDALYTQSVADDKCLLDLPTLAAHQLQSAGVHIKSSLPVPCSYADLRYYSYRRKTHLQRSATGRMALIIVRHF